MVSTLLHATVGLTDYISSVISVLKVFTYFFFFSCFYWVQGFSIADLPPAPTVHNAFTKKWVGFRYKIVLSYSILSAIKMAWI